MLWAGLLLFAAAITPWSASGADQVWKLVRAPHDRPYDLYVDVGNIVRDGRTRLFTTKIVSTSPSAQYAFAITAMKIDCSANVEEGLSVRLVDRNGKVGNAPLPPPLVIKTAMDVAVRDLVCLEID